MRYGSQMELGGVTPPCQMHGGVTTGGHIKMYVDDRQIFFLEDTWFDFEC